MARRASGGQLQVGAAFRDVDARIKSAGLAGDFASQTVNIPPLYQTDESYSYDANGNRTMSGYTTGSNNQLTNDGTYSYIYDNEGNRTKRTKTSSGDYSEFAWDYRNRLTNATEKNSSNTVLSTVDYVYDTFDRRIKKSYDADGPGGGSAVVSRYVYDGDHIVLQFPRRSHAEWRRKGTNRSPLDEMKFLAAFGRGEEAQVVT